MRYCRVDIMRVIMRVSQYDFLEVLGRGES